MKYFKYYLITIGIIFLDQITKLLVHFNMKMGIEGQIKLIGNWLKLHYITNPGMAFGIQINSGGGKLFLTLFRLVAMVVIAIYLYRLAKKGNTHSGVLWCMALILAGAVGNVVDSIFYGKFLGNAPLDSATPWFHGQVIDMIYVDVWEGMLPKWIPFIGGEYYSFWPIFNIADSSIFVGVAILLLFQRKFFKRNQLANEQNKSR